MGQSFKKDKNYGGVHVPYEIRLKSGELQKHDMALNNDNKEARFIVDGGI